MQTWRVREEEGRASARWSRDRWHSGGVAVKDFKGPYKHNIRSRSTDLAKLNP